MTEVNLGQIIQKQQQQDRDLSINRRRNHSNRYESIQVMGRDGTNSAVIDILNSPEVMITPTIADNNR